MSELTIRSILIILAVLGSCSQRRENQISNGLNDDYLYSAEGIDEILIDAYAMLAGTKSIGSGLESSAYNWVLGSIRGGEANKGGTLNDLSFLNPIQNYSETSSNAYLKLRWKSIFEAVDRCNEVIQYTIDAKKRETIGDSVATNLTMQARALRGYFYLEAFKIWENISLGNNKKDEISIQTLIIEDLKFGADLPNNMGQVGRFNGTVVRILLAKAYLQINQDYLKALVQLENAIVGSKPDGSAIGLQPNYGDIFKVSERNGLEAIYTIQFAVNDGSGGLNTNEWEIATSTNSTGSPNGCCVYFQPTQEFVNSFRTENGLPFLNREYNDIQVNKRFDGALDPRLDWTIGRNGIPFLDWGLHGGAKWVRDSDYAGFFTHKKQVFKRTQEDELTNVGGWASGFTTNGYRMIRYADLLLLMAECYASTGNLEAALEYVNKVRIRAANPEGFVMNNGVPAANYMISPYSSFPDKKYALLAIRMERKLELGMEGHRYFDLKRWGIASEEISAFLSYEKKIKFLMYKEFTTFDLDNLNYPIPEL